MKYRFSLTAMALATLLLSSCNEKVYYAAQFGIQPNDSTKNTSPLMKKAIQTLKEKHPKRAVRLVLAPGNYDFYPKDCTVKEYYISNHDQDNPKRVAIDLEGMNKFTLDGNGANIYTHGRMIPLAMVDCKNTTIKNISFDSRIPQIAQATVLKNDKEKGEITYELDHETRYEINNGRLCIFGQGWSLTPGAGIAFEGDTKHVVYRTSDIGVGTSNVTEMGAYIIKAPWRNDKLVPGTVVALRSYGRPTPGIFLSQSKNTELEKVTVHYAEGMGLLAQMSENISLDHFNIALRKGSRRYFTTQADATHFSGCKGKIKSVNGLYEGMMDDAINVHGTYLRITQRLDDHTVVGRYMHGQTYGFYWGGAGDKVQFVKSNTMEITEENQIATIEPYDKKEIKGCKEFKISFKEQVPEDIANGNYGVENLEWTPEVYFAGNTIRNNRARGSLFSTPKRTLVENNFFDHTSGTAILLCGDCNGWFETGACREVVIRNNRFVNALTNMFQFTNAIISIYPEIPNLKDQKKYFHGGEGKGVTIENNVFETFDMPLVYAKSLDGLVFRNNKIIQNNDYQPFHWNQHRFLFERVINKTIENNTFENATFDAEKDIKDIQ